jgi:hypothetical protein
LWTSQLRSIWIWYLTKRYALNRILAKKLHTVAIYYMATVCNMI